MKMHISKKEVAMKLYPESMSVIAAAQRLRREINETKGLKKRLHQLGGSLKHSYNKQQMGLLLERFGLTENEFEALS
jgi:hypothetical protein